MSRYKYWKIRLTTAWVVFTGIMRGKSLEQILDEQIEELSKGGCMNNPSKTMTAEHIKVAARQLQEAEITIDEFLQLVSTYIRTIELPEKVENYDLLIDTLQAKAKGFNAALDLANKVIEEAADKLGGNDG